MNNNYRFIAIGDLVIDRVIDKFGYTVKEDGGGSKFNVLSRIASNRGKALVFSGCGKDKSGDIAIHSLKKYGVDISHIVRYGNQTKTYELQRIGNGEFKSTKKNWYKDSIITIDIVKRDILPEDVIVMDNLTNFDIEILNSFKNDKVLDIGRINMLEKLSNNQIEKYLKGRLEIIQTNEKVEKYIRNRFGYSNISSLYEILQPNLLVVTKGKNGADFITSDKIWHKGIKKPAIEVDTTGAGDAFFSVIISNYYEYVKDKNAIDDTFVNNTFFEALKVTKQVVSYMGSRGDLDHFLDNNKTSIVQTSKKTIRKDDDIIYE